MDRILSIIGKTMRYMLGIMLCIASLGCFISGGGVFASIIWLVFGISIFPGIYEKTFLGKYKNAPIILPIVLFVICCFIPTNTGVDNNINKENNNLYTYQTQENNTTKDTEISDVSSEIKEEGLESIKVLNEVVGKEEIQTESQINENTDTKDNAKKEDNTSVKSSTNTSNEETTSNNSTSAKKNETTNKNTNNNSDNTKSTSNGRTVYVTPTGKRYHYRSSCGGKNSSSTSLTLAKQMGLTPCKKCAQ